MYFYKLTFNLFLKLETTLLTGHFHSPRLSSVQSHESD